jgi:hypothetical protein
VSPILESIGSVKGFGWGAFSLPSSFESIASVVGTSSSTTISFDSIPADYKHLQIRGTSYDGTGYSVRMRFNNDSGSNYARHFLTGTGASANAGGSGSELDMVVINTNGNTSDYPASLIVDIYDYASTTKYKTARTFTGLSQNDTSGEVSLRSGLWMSTSAITSIQLLINGASFTNLTRLALYGIKG